MTDSTDTTSPGFRARAEARRLTWSITRFHDGEAIKDAEYDDWASQPTSVVMAAVSEMTTRVYAMKGIHVSRLHRPHRAPEQA
jgi:hypothetical protein